MASGGSAIYRSTAGTVLLKYASDSFGRLIIDGQNLSVLDTELTPIGRGVVQAVTADTITTDGGMTFLPGALVGHTLQPDITDGREYRVVSNTANTITVTLGAVSAVLRVMRAVFAVIVAMESGLLLGLR